jgi:hypothetical protein
MTSFNPQHLGLLTSEHELTRLEGRQQNPVFVSAWEQINASGETLPVSLAQDGLVQAVWRASQFHFARYAPHTVTGNPQDLGAQAVAHLQAGAGMESENKYLLSMQRAIGAMHAFEMVREHDAWNGQQSDWLGALRTHLHELLSVNEPRPLEAFWQIPLQIAGAIVLEDSEAFTTGTNAFERTINEYLHPEGYFKILVMLKDGKTFQRQQSGVKALVLAAEMARHAGYDLWQYDNRGVSLMTGIAYQVYYYFYPEKWRWEAEDTYTTEMMQEAFQHGGAYMEIAAERGKPRSVEMLLEERRPLFDAFSGGFTTLTHGRDGIMPISQEEAEGDKRDDNSHKKDDKKRKRRGFFRRG